MDQPNYMVERQPNNYLLLAMHLYATTMEGCNEHDRLPTGDSQRRHLDIGHHTAAHDDFELAVPPLCRLAASSQQHVLEHWGRSVYHLAIVCTDNNMAADHVRRQPWFDAKGAALVTAAARPSSSWSSGTASTSNRPVATAHNGGERKPWADCQSVFVPCSGLSAHRWWQ